MKADVIDTILKVGGGGALGSAVSAFFSWLSNRAKARAAAPADMQKAIAEFQATLNAGATELIGQLRAEVLELKHDNNQMRQYIESLTRDLRRAGMDIPDFQPVQSFTKFEDGHEIIFPAPGSAAR